MDDTPGRVDRGSLAAADDTDDRTVEIRREIEQTREELSETVEAIQDKLRPANLVSSATGRAKQAVTERVRDMTQAVGSRAGSMTSRGTSGGIGREIRQNPLPVALIGIGAAWWIINARSRSQEYRNIDRNRTFDEQFDRPYTYGEDVAGRGQSPTSSESEGLSGSVETATHLAHEYTRDVTSRVRGTGMRAQTGLERLTRENPLAVGAGALLLGTIVGLVLPQTAPENQLMGETRDNVLDRAQNAARDMARRAQSAAADVVDDAASTIVGSPE